MRGNLAIECFRAIRQKRRERLFDALAGEDAGIFQYAFLRIPYSMKHYEGHATRVARVTRHLKRILRLWAVRGPRNLQKVVHHHPPASPPQWGNSP